LCSFKSLSGHLATRSEREKQRNESGKTKIFYIIDDQIKDVSDLSLVIKFSVCYSDESIAQYFHLGVVS
jgi:hypothetical protein